MNKIMDWVLNLQMFSTVINATTSNTTGNDLSPEMKTYYQDRLIDLVEPLLVHDQFGQKRPIPQGRGKTTEFRAFTKLPKITTQLVEGVTPDGQALDSYTVTSTVKQYGGYVCLTDFIMQTAIDPIAEEALKLIASQGARSMDTVTREIINAGTNVQYGDGSKSSRSSLTASDKLTVLAVRKAVRALKRQDAPMINGNYVAIVHPDIAFDLMSDSTWVDWQKYTSPEHMYKNEIGQIAGVRFVETTEAKIFEGAGASSADVYSTLIIGEGAYGVTDISGGGLQTIIKQKGSGGTSDPLDQRATVGWKCAKTAEILVNEYMVRIETGATA